LQRGGAQSASCPTAHRSRVSPHTNAKRRVPRTTPRTGETLKGGIDRDRPQRVPAVRGHPVARPFAGDHLRLQAGANRAEPRKKIRRCRFISLHFASTLLQESCRLRSTPAVPRRPFCARAIARRIEAAPKTRRGAARTARPPKRAIGLGDFMRPKIVAHDGAATRCARPRNRRADREKIARRSVCLGGIPKPARKGMQFSWARGFCDHGGYARG